MKRRPRPLVVTTALPALSALLAAGLVEGCRNPIRTSNPPEPVTPPTPPSPAADAGARRLPPTLLDPDNLPMMPSGAVAPVRPGPSPAGELPVPRPSAVPSAAMPAAPVPSAAAAQAAGEAAQAAWGAGPQSGLNANAAPARYIVHDHPPGTPCTPISQDALRRAVGRGG